MVVENGVYKSSPEGNSALAFSDGRRLRQRQKPEVELNVHERGQRRTSTPYRAPQQDPHRLTAPTCTANTSPPSPPARAGDGWFVRFRGSWAATTSPSAASSSSIVTEIKHRRRQRAHRRGQPQSSPPVRRRRTLGMVARLSFEDGDRVTLEVSVLRRAASRTPTGSPAAATSSPRDGAIDRPGPLGQRQ